MSLNRLALRLATVLALRGQTTAGDRVWDSRIGEIDDLAAREAQPFILVYVDDEEAAGDATALRKSQRSVSLTIELAMGIFSSSQDGFELLMPATDAQLEVALDVLEMQVLDALQEVASAARDLWAALVQSIEAVRIRRGAWSDDDRATRHAARLIEMRVRIPRDPPATGQATPLMDQLITLLEQQPDSVLADMAVAIREQAERQPGRPSHQVMAALLGASRSVAEALMIDPDHQDGYAFAADQPDPDAQPTHLQP